MAKMRIPQGINLYGNVIERGGFERLAAFPSTDNFAGRIVQLTTDGLFYKRNEANNGWDVLGNEGSTYTGNKIIDGYLNTKLIFNPNLNTTPWSSLGGFVLIGVNSSTGNDSLSENSYPVFNSATIINYFATLQAALTWASKCTYNSIRIKIENTTVNTPVTIDSTTFISSKSRIVFYGITTQYIRLNAYLSIYDSIASFDKIHFQLYINDSLTINNNSSAYLSNSIITPETSVTSLINLQDGIFDFDSGQNTVNFSANNQVLFHCSGNDGGKVIFSNHTGLGETFNVGAFTGLRWGSNTPTRNLETWFVSTPTTPIPSAIDISDTICYFGTSSGFRVASYNAEMFNYAINAGTTKPIRFTDINSSSSDGIYTTKKKLVINELGEVIPVSDTASTISDFNTAVDARVALGTAGLYDDRGNYDASVGTFPTTGGSGSAGAILKGDVFLVSVAGTLGGVVYSIGDSFRALVDTPGQTAGNWASMKQGTLSNVVIKSSPVQIGNGSLSVIGVTHNLNTKNIKAIVRKVSNDEIWTLEPAPTSVNACNLDFGAVVPSTNEFEVVIIAG